MDYAERMLAWFDVNKREMPWRNTSDPYAIWVSEIMLQQTQVDTVIPYYINFMKRFPTIQRLASAPLEEVYNYWEGLGYYRRAQNLHKGAQMVEREYGGVFPKDVKLVKEIPGIGPYTLGAVLSIAFHMPLPAVDGNVMRILSRQFLIKDDISEAKSRKVFEKKVMELMPEDPNRFNQALMEHGALICTPKTPKCHECPVQTICMAYQQDVVNLYPVKTPKQKVIVLAYYVLIITKDNAFWMEKRPEEGLLANLWGFPMITREEFEASGYEYLQIDELKPVSHVFTHRKWEMEPLLIELGEEKILKEIMSRAKEGKFVSLAEMNSLPIGTAFKRVIKELRTYRT
jgi:A/G-specific adenine glycosylase